MSAAYRDASGYGPVCGVGIYEPRVLCMRDSPETEKAYRIWNNMLRRAEPKFADQYPSYAGTSVAPEFHRFADFAQWAMQQTGWNSEGHQLDKDLLVKGNRVYSPQTCVFVPRAINMVLTTTKRLRGALPIGVKMDSNGRFAARLKIDDREVRAGVFDDPISAFAAYKEAKEANIRRMADLYRDRIDARAYDALMAYTVEITD